MLRSINHSAHSIFAKILLAVLVVSFGFWGIGDIVHQSGGMGSVAKVGNETVSMPEYREALRRQQDAMRQKLGNKYSPDLIHKFGVDKMVRDQLVINLLVEEEAKSLGIVVSDEDVAKDIQSNPGFKGPDGHFDKTVYQEVMRNNNLSEARYIGDLRKDIAAKLINKTLSSGTIPPEEMVRALYELREEQRSADVLLVPLSAVTHVPQPTDKDIKTYYDAHSSEFAAPEYRTVSYIVLKEADMIQKTDVSEDEIKQAYAEHAQDFHKPERRKVEQLIFENEADAKAASDKLAHGAKFADMAGNAKIINKGKTDLGTVSKEEVPTEVAEPVFALKENGNTAPVHTEFGWHVLHVSKIEPESTAQLSEVHDTIAKDIAGKGAQDAMGKLVNNLEDAMAGGATLEKAAEKANQKVYNFGPATRDGTSPDGKKLAIPAFDNFMDIAFSTPDKDHSQPVQANDNSYFLLRVDTVEPEHTRPLAEVKNQVVAGWVKEKKSEMLQALASSIASDLRAGKALGATLASHNVSLSTSPSGMLKRTSESLTSGPLAKQDLPPRFIMELFSLKPHESTHAYGLASGDSVIATLKQVIPAPQAGDNSDVFNAIRDELKETMVKETLQDYLNYLGKKYHVANNDAALGIADDSSAQQ